MRAGTASRFRLREDPHLERVRREVRLGRHFSPAEFERAFRSFRQMYQVPPTLVLCAPDVLDRYCELFERSGAAHRRELRFEGARIAASIVPPGIVAFEGEVDADRMGDW
jgi:hypothetical protein